MSSLEVCAACLITDVRMVKFTPTVRKLYWKISGLQVKAGKIMPKICCYLCYGFIKKSIEFRKKCQIAHKILNRMHNLSNGTLSKSEISLLDRKAVGVETSFARSEIKQFEYIELHEDTFKLESNAIILPTNVYEEPPIDVKSENIENENIFVFEETAVDGDNDDSRDEEVKDEQKVEDALVNEVPDDDRKKAKPPLITDRFTIKCMNHTELDRQMLTKKQSAAYVNKKFKCNLCYMGFNKDTSYAYHMHRHEYGVFGEFQCDICKKYEKTKARISRHIHKFHYYQYTCKICNAILYTATSATFHFTKKHRKQSFTCRFCNKDFRTIHTLSTHTKYRHSTVPCDVCGDCFVNEQGLKYHKKYKHKVKDSPQTVIDKADPLYCIVCETLFKDDDAFYNHARKSSRHSNEDVKILAKKTGKRVFQERLPRMVQCAVCLIMLPSFHQATKHYKSLHPGVDLPREHMCDLCGKTFTFPSTLQAHRNTHTKDEIFDCSVCNKTFYSYTSRARHMAVTHREKSFECSYCNNKFAYKCELKLHTQTVHMKIPYLPRLRAQKRRTEERKRKSLLQSEDI